MHDLYGPLAIDFLVALLLVLLSFSPVSFAHLESVLFWGELVQSSTACMIFAVCAGLLAGLQAYINLVWLGEIAITTSGIGKEAEFKIKALRIVILVQEIVVALLVSVPLVGVRAAASNSSKFGFSRAFYAAFCLQFFTGGILGIYYTTVILNSIRSHVSAGKQRAATNQQGDVSAVENAAKRFVDIFVIEDMDVLMIRNENRIANVRAAFAIVFLFVIYAAVTAAIPSIMTYYLPVTYIQMCLVNITSFRELRPGKDSASGVSSSHTT